MEALERPAPAGENTMTPLKRALLAIEKLQNKLAALEHARTEPVAIIGMACRFPGADGPEAFWRLLQDGIDAIHEVPADRWDLHAFYDPEPGKPGKMYTRWGGFLDRVDLFDPQAFGISPREAARMDPQQRLLLEVSWEAFENAGLNPEKLAGARAGVFVGISSNDYGMLLAGACDPTLVDAYTGTGNAFSIAANRLSYVYDLQGPSIAVDTACSSSLVTTHMAVQSLRRGESDLALAGGVNVMLAPGLHVTFSHARMMSPNGRCKTFDASADGYVRGEGCGLVVLKRLSDAQRDGDRILAVILGSAVNQDGRSNGLTAPNALAQQAVIQGALADAGVTPAQIGYVEAHGTGTILGDPIEMRSLGAIMAGRSLDQPCIVGSVKTNIGHLEAAAGIAGLIKTTLMLQHGEIAPHLHFQQINPYIPLDELPLRIATGREPWPADSARIAGVSAFGFGGTNAHVILGEAPAQPAPVNPIERDRHILALSAHSEPALRQLAQRYAAALATAPEAALADICFTANAGRQHHGCRVALTGVNATTLREQLEAVSRGEIPPATIRPTRPRTAFLFTGQGAQRVGMGRRLFETQPAFRRALERCDEILRDQLERPLLSVLYPSEAEQAAAAQLINETAYTQPALFAVEYALAQLWLSWDVQPDALLGHSVGEYVAACLADVFSLEDGLKLIAARGRLMGTLPHGGDMAAVFADAARVTAAIAPYRAEVAIAAVNGPQNVVISGRREAVTQAVAALQGAGIVTRPLTVSHAFHSPLMDPILDAFEMAAREVIYRPPQIPVISNLTGELLTGAPDAVYWRRHIREAVQFNAGMQALASLGCRLFVETGPNPTLIGMGKRCLPDTEATWAPSLKAGADDWETLLGGLAAAYTAGAEIDWDGFDAEYARRKVALPTYPFQRERYWLNMTPRWSSPNATPADSGAGSGLWAADETEAIVESPQPASAAQSAGLQLEASQVDAAPTAPALTRADLLAAPVEAQPSLLIETMQSHIARVLGLDAARLSPDSRLNNLGLDSIMAIELKSAVETMLKVDLPIAILLQGPSIAELADTLLALLAVPSEEQTPALTAAEEPDLTEPRDYPLSAGQRAMWLQHQVAPGSVYNPVYAVRIRSAIDVERLQQTLQALVDRHPALRTSFGAHDGEPFQRVHPHMTPHFHIEDISGWRDAELAERLADEAYKPFNLETGSLLRVFLFTRAAEEHILLLAAHHIVIDLWSLAVLINELGMLYGTGFDVPLPSNPVRYTDFVRWQQALLASPAGDRMTAYWLEKLAGDLPDLNLPTDRPRPAVQTFSGSVESLDLGPELTRAIRQLSERLGITPYVTLLAAFQTLLHRYTGQTDIIVGSPTTGRSRAELANVVGYFVSPVAMRASFTDDPTFAQLLTQVHETVLGALANADYPFPLLVEKLRPHRDPSRTPVFQVMFALQRAHLLYEEGLSQFALGAAGTVMQLGGLPLEAVSIRQRMSPFDLTMLVADSEHDLGAAIEYNTDLFDATTVQRMLAHYRTLLEGIVTDPTQRVAELPMLTEAEQRQIVDVWSQGPEAPLPFACIHHAVEAQAARTPDAIALYFEPGGGATPVTLTYHELNARANQLAHHLQALAVGPETLVGLCLARSVEMIVGILGVLKAGGAYVPLDPLAPAARLASILQDAGANIVLTQAQVLESNSWQPEADRWKLADGRAAWQGPLVQLDTDWPTIARQPATNLSIEQSTNHLAYVIYTSGSTGAPKGVMLTHRGLVNLVQAQVVAFDVTPQDRVLQFAAYTFDASVSEIFIALTSGAALHLVRQETVWSPGNLAAALRSQRITNATLPPTLLRLLDPAALPDLRTVISAGEACTPDIVARWTPGRRLVNAYGPTETTIGPTYQIVNAGATSGAGLKPAPTATAAPIGRPIHNIQAYILDRHMQPVPAGVPGELYIGGFGLARGYVGQPELTAERFVPNPFAADAAMGRRGDGETRSSPLPLSPSPLLPITGSRLYRTGDLARWLPDGAIEFIGRADFQVKIRGFRVEPGEIEAVLARHDAVKEAAVIARDDLDDGPGRRNDLRLVAYVAPKAEAKSADGADATLISDLRAHLKSVLPDYMTPAAFVLLDRLPLNASGKVDRKALPRPVDLHPVATEQVAPATQLERDLAAIWQEVLGVEKVSVTDNFFDLGGHSLLMAQAHSRLQALIGREIPIVALFRFPSIRALARHLAQEDGEASAASQASAVRQGLDRAQLQRDALAQQRERMKARTQRRSG